MQWEARATRKLQIPRGQDGPTQRNYGNQYQNHEFHARFVYTIHLVHVFTNQIIMRIAVVGRVLASLR